jgi:hypothetical protein
MVTHRKPILGVNTRPGNSGNVFQEPKTVKLTTTPFSPMVFIFNDTATRDALHGRFDVPLTYIDTANLVIVWTCTATSGDVEWDFDYRAVGGNDTESLNTAGNQESVNSNDTAPGAAGRRMELTISLTDGNFAPGDTVDFTLFRDGTDGGDTIAAAVILLELFFEYNDA